MSNLGWNLCLISLEKKLIISEPLGATHLAAPLAMEDYCPLIPSSAVAMAHSSARQGLALSSHVLPNAALPAADLRGGVR